MKKHICLILSFILVLSSLTFNVSASESDSSVPFSYQVYSEKQSYKKGEEIVVWATVKNTSLDEIADMRIQMDYPLTDYYLTPGVTEHFVEAFNEYDSLKFRVSEDEGVLNFASKFENTKFIRRFLLKLAHAYKSLTLAYTTIKYGIQNAFISFNQKKSDLGTVKVMYDNSEIEFTIKCRYSVIESEKNEARKISNDKGIATADIKAVNNSCTGICFAMNENNSEFGLFAVNPYYGKAFVYNVKDGKYNMTASKSVNIAPENYYQMKVLFCDNRVLCYLSDNPLDTDPYPVFDLYYVSNETGYGVFCKQDDCKNFNVSPGQLPEYDKTYTNPVYENAPDPYILRDGENYYLYATTDAGSGYRVACSKDLVNWENLGFCAQKGDIYGNDKFWAPEVYRYKSKYYMLYSTDEHLALAVSDSPAGPFMKTKEGYLLEDKCIDGHLLFDDDGSVYMYMAYWGKTGEEIYGCKMAEDLSGVVPGTVTRLTSCKKDEGGVNEGPFMLKYKGRYYLTYSVNGYDNHNYSVRLAVSDSPLGVYNGKGTILEKCGPLVGTGHHSFTTSPDGTELIIAYHCHYSTTQVHARKLCIDRCKFVETNDGYTISVYGPTSTAQPFPF